MKRMMADIKHSQNYIKSKNLVRSLVERSGIRKKDYVIEIGPGKGTITDVLADYADRVTAVEYDAALYERLTAKRCRENVEYVKGDFLQYALPLKGSYKVFSNIPFQITADIMRKLTECANPPEEMFLILQKEAAKKYCGIPHQKQEGLRAALLKARYEVGIVCALERSDFYPVPGVDIVLLHVKKKKNPPDEESFAMYRDLVSYFYACGKGNTAGERLLALFSKEQVKRLARKYRIGLSTSYTMITAGQWAGISRYAAVGLSPEKKAKIKGAYGALVRQQRQLKKQNRTALRSGGKSQNR